MERVGPFRIVRELGRGGMAQTYVAEREGPAGFRHEVCLKTILPHHAADPEWIRAFQAEARVLSTLRHPNIVPIHDFGQDGNVWWMALELVDGADLGAILRGLRDRNERMPIEHVVTIATEVAKALAYAHARPSPIIHRDVSPPNILIGADGTVKLADFGLAKSPHGDRTRTGVVKGKVPYMAPEQALGERNLDHRVDLFALGVVMFEMLAGERPFRGKTDLAVQMEIVSGRRARLGEVASHAPAELVAAVDGLLQTERERRVTSATVLLQALQRLGMRGTPHRTLAEVAAAICRLDEDGSPVGVIAAIRRSPVGSPPNGDSS